MLVSSRIVLVQEQVDTKYEDLHLEKESIGGGFWNLLSVECLGQESNCF